MPRNRETGEVLMGPELLEYHTLRTRPTRLPLYNWHAFLKAWNEAEDHQRQFDLLFEGFTVSIGKGSWEEKEYEWIDRVIFYLDIADGWNESSSFSFGRLVEDRGTYQIGYDEHGHPVKLDVTGLDQRLARKAFQGLCLNFFKNVEVLTRDRDGFHRNWEEEIVTDKFFPVIQYFFRVKVGYLGGIHICNLPRGENSHGESEATAFLLKLARFMWGWKEDQVDTWRSQDDQDQQKKRNTEMRVRIDSAKPWMVEVLSELGELEILREWLFKLDNASIAKLTEIAMRGRFYLHSHPVVKDRPVESVDEAFLLGSVAARILKERELKMEVDGRLREIRNKTEEVEAASLRLQELTGKGK